MGGRSVCPWYWYADGLPFTHIMPIHRVSRSHGFTLVELLVVIAMIAVLATITVTMTFRFRKSADRTSSINALRQIQLGNISYAMEHNGSFVPPEAMQVDADGVETGVSYRWFENPDFITHLKGAEATYPGGSTEPDITLTASLLDLAVIRKKSLGNTDLGNCFGYTAPSGGGSFRQAQLSSPGDSAAFLTCDEPFVDHATKSKIAYRHHDTALVAYYDGRAAILKKSDVKRIDSAGGAANVFWTADRGTVAP